MHHSVGKIVKKNSPKECVTVNSALKLQYHIVKVHLLFWRPLGMVFLILPKESGGGSKNFIS